MKVFLIILAVLALIFAIILSLSAEFTVIYENGWHTKIRILFFEKDIELSKLLSFVLFPEKAAQDKKAEKEESKEETAQETQAEEAQESAEVKHIKKEKKNYIQKILDEDGIVGIMLLISNLLQTAGKAVTTLIKGLHIYSLYVKMIIGGGDAADIGNKYGEVCGIYYPIKGFILNSMKVDMYDDFIQPDFIAPGSEYEFQLIASINIALLLRVALRAGKVFLINLIKNK
jgi:hypothetical protein